MSEAITIDNIPYTEEELAELLGIESLDSLSQAELEALLDEANNDISRQLSEFITATAIASALALLNIRGPGVRYFTPREEYYRGRRPVPQQRIDQLVASHRRQASQRTLRHARDLLNNRISLREYHERMARDIVNGHVRMMELGAGGRRRMTRGHWARLQDQLYGDGPGRGDLNRLRQHVERIRLGELSDAQIRDRSRRYGSHVGVSHNNGRWESLLSSPYEWEARRWLGTNKNHCLDCLGYSTGGRWRPAIEVVPQGVDCRCDGACLCRWEARRRLARDGFDTENFSEVVLNESQAGSSKKTAATQANEEQPTGNQFLSWAERPGPKTVDGIISKARRRQKQGRQKVPVLRSKLAQIEDELERKRIAFDKFKSENPGLTRAERKNSPLAKEMRPLIQERDTIFETIERLENGKNASDAILNGYNRLPRDIKRRLRNRDQTVQDAAATQLEIVKLNDKLQRQPQEGQAQQIDRAKINALAETNSRNFMDQEGINSMRDLRDRLLQRGSGKTTNAKYDLPPGANVDQYKNVLDEFVKITNGKGAQSLRTVVFEDERASARRDGRLDVGAGFDRSTLFHEMGHHVEFESQLLTKQANSLIRDRSIAGLRTMPGYNPSEKAYPDHWSSPYTAKSYPDGDTEVFSMGLQHFSDPESMWRLYIEDREHFFVSLGAILDDSSL